MKSTLHLFGNIFSLACIEPIVSDTDLKGENLEVLKERVFKGTDGSFGVEILSSGLIEVTAFPPAIPCSELVRECIARYDPISETIRRDNGETLLAINREVISSIFKLPDYQFSNFSPTQSITEFNTDRTGHQNNVEKYWLKVPQRGGSRLPNNPNKNHMLPHIHDVMLLLHQVRGSTEAYSFDD
ncbi:hypothetical protein SUGI_0402190 [Cryptomeria japonica]|nr:hypothetical protein SUGI_0402190 [Cryptomeria japonica]